MNHFDYLPNELIVKIFENLDFTKLKIPDVQLVCKRFYSLSQHPSLHRELRIPNNLSFKEVLHVVNQRPSIKTLTIVGIRREDETLRSSWDSFLKSHLPEVNETLSLPSGCIYVVEAKQKDMPNLLEDAQIDTLHCDDFKTYGTFDGNSKSFLSNLKKLQINECFPLTDNDLINIAKSCLKLKTFSFGGRLSDSAYDIFFKRMKSTLTDLSICPDGKLFEDKAISRHVLNSIAQCTKLTRLELMAACNGFQENLFSKENLPLLKRLELVDYALDDEQFGDFENWFKRQDFSHLAELDMHIVPDDPHALLLDISNICPNLVKLLLTGELIGDSDNLSLLKRFPLLEAFTLFTAPEDLNSDNFRELLSSFESGVTKLKEIDLTRICDKEINDSEIYYIPEEDFPELKRLAQTRGIKLIFSISDLDDLVSVSVSGPIHI